MTNDLRSEVSSATFDQLVVCFGFLHGIVGLFSDISKERSASVFRVTESGSGVTRFSYPGSSGTRFTHPEDGSVIRHTF